MIAAPTKSGKTTLARQLVQKRIDAGGFVVMPVTKPEDRTITQDFKGWTFVKDWAPRKGTPHRTDQLVVVWPRLTRGMDSSALLREQKRVFKAMFDDLLHKGRRTLIVDEMHMMSDPHYIGMAKDIALQFHQGRSAYVTMMVLTQRPAWIPSIVYPSITHAYIGKTNKKQDLDRLGELGGIDNKEVANIVRTLPSRHDFLYLNPLGDSPMQIINTQE